MALKFRLAGGLAVLLLGGIFPDVVRSAGWLVENEGTTNYLRLSHPRLGALRLHFPEVLLSAGERFDNLDGMAGINWQTADGWTSYRHALGAGEFSCRIRPAADNVDDLELQVEVHSPGPGLVFTTTCLQLGTAQQVRDTARVRTFIRVAGAWSPLGQLDPGAWREPRNYPLPGRPPANPKAEPPNFRPEVGLIAVQALNSSLALGLWFDEPVGVTSNPLNPCIHVDVAQQGEPTTSWTGRGRIVVRADGLPAVWEAFRAQQPQAPESRP